MNHSRFGQISPKTSRTLLVLITEPRTWYHTQSVRECELGSMLLRDQGLVSDQIGSPSKLDGS